MATPQRASPGSSVPHRTSMFAGVFVVVCFMITSRLGEVFVSRGTWRGNENQIWGINVFALLENDGIYTIRGLHGADQIVLIYFPFHSHFAHNPSISWVIFTPSRQSFFSPVCKCTIKELVVRNHRIWTRAKSRQLFMRRPQILNWSPLLQPCPHHHGHHPGGWHRQEGETSHLHARQCPAQTRPFKTRGEAMLRWLATGLQTEMYLKQRSPKIVKSWILQPCFYW